MARLPGKHLQPVDRIVEKDRSLSEVIKCCHCNTINVILLIPQPFSNNNQYRNM